MDNIYYNKFKEGEKVNNKIQWTFIYGTENKYILTSTGRVFSGKHGDYLKPNEKNFYYYVKIQFLGDKKPKNISIYKLLSIYFPESLKHKEYYKNVERWTEIYG